jgi:hypothetical protein
LALPRSYTRDICACAILKDLGHGKIFALRKRGGGAGGRGSGRPRPVYFLTGARTARIKKQFKIKKNNPAKNQFFKL